MIDREHFGKIAVEDHPARQQQIFRRIVVGVFGNVAIAHDAFARQSAAVKPILVKGGDGREIGQIDLFDEFDRAIDDGADLVEPLHVDRADGAGPVDIDRAGHAADQPVGMRILAAVDGVDLDDFLLEIERLQIMRDGHQIGLGRQPVGGMAPIGVLERAELARLHELLEADLQILEIAGRRQRPIGNRLRQRRGRLGIGGKRRHDIDPVERVQMIEMHEVIMHLQRQLHDVADRVGVLRDRDSERVLDRAHGGQRVRARADAADALCEGPGVPRVAPAQDHLDPAPHRAGRHRVADHIVLVDVDLDAQMPFDPCHRIDDDTLAGVVEVEAVRRFNAHDCVSPTE